MGHDEVDVLGGELFRAGSGSSFSLNGLGSLTNERRGLISQVDGGGTTSETSGGLLELRSSTSLIYLGLTEDDVDFTRGGLEDIRFTDNENSLEFPRSHNKEHQAKIKVSTERNGRECNTPTHEFAASILSLFSLR